jgi:hypothetical protein
MMNEQPDWKDAPEWAQFLAMDSTGQWFWFVNEPRLGEHHWMPVPMDDGQDYENAYEVIDGAFSISQPWTTTLEARP